MISFILIILLISLRTWNVKSRSAKKEKLLLSLWVIFTASVLITNLINNDNILNVIILCTIIPYYFIYKTQNYKFLKHIILISVLLSSALILLNVVGIFNPLSIHLLLKTNSMGLFMVFFSIYTLYKFYHSDYYIFLVLFNLLFIILSSSRTALICFCLVLSIVMVLKIMSENFARAFLRGYFTLSAIVLIGLLLILNKNIIFEIDVIKKVLYYSSLGNNFNGRDIIWTHIVNNINFTGHNMGNLFSLYNLSPHSNFLGILYSNGLIAFIAFVLINILMMIKITKRMRNSNDGIFNLIIMLVFIFTSITEYYYNILGISVVFLWYICLGNVMFTKESINPSE